MLRRLLDFIILCCFSSNLLPVVCFDYLMIKDLFYNISLLVTLGSRSILGIRGRDSCFHDSLLKPEGFESIISKQTVSTG